MAQLIDKIRQVETTSSGEASFNFSYPMGVIIKQIVVTPATPTTIFNATILDGDGEAIYVREGESDSLNELLDLPVKGNYTLEITSATADEEFVFKIMAYETES